MAKKKATPKPLPPEQPAVNIAEQLERYKTLYNECVVERDKLAEQLNVAHFVLGKATRQLAENVTTIQVGTD